MISEVSATAEDVRDDIGRILDPVLEPALIELAGSLRSVPKLASTERDAIHAGIARSLRETVWPLVSRAVVLELHIARRAGRFTATDSANRWQEWVNHLSGPAGWDELAAIYPALRPRLETVVGNRCTAALRLARRYAHDRASLAGLPGGETGKLTEVEFGFGASRYGGQTTTMLKGGNGRLVYKPRSVAVDAALGVLLSRLLPEEPADTRIRVPEVLPGQDADGGYGWARHVAHRYCYDDAELRAFYRGLGQWLAVLELLSGSDLHAENLIAAGPVPTVVDCETLFTPLPPMTFSGYGKAADRARELLGGSVLATGLLPGRVTRSGLRGLDVSGAAALPGQQPVLHVAGLVGQGRDEVSVGLIQQHPSARLHLPCPEPDLVRYWKHVEDGYLRLADELHRLDRDGQLAGLLADFADCPIRSVRRGTASYADIGDMLWHPSSLHRPEKAARRARELLARHAGNIAGAPGDPAVIAAEVADLLDGDLPVFTTTARCGVLTGPRGTRFGQPEDLLAATLTRWRASDPAVNRRLIGSTMVSAYLNEGEAQRWRPPLSTPHRVAGNDVDRRRRALAAGIIERLGLEAIRGDDGTATWVAPAYGAAGWSVRPIPPDMYSGLMGTAVALAGYRREVAAGRADPVAGLESLLDATLASLRLAEDALATERDRAREAGIPVRPEPPGAYIGLGARIWGWLLLHRLGAVDATHARTRAEASAALLAASIAADETYDLLAGTAGAVVPLLALAAHGKPARWRALAQACAERLRAAATVDDSGARWATAQHPQGLGGLAHGAAGIGWALAQLAAESNLASAAFCWQETLYEPIELGWRDLRRPGQTACLQAWCHGAVGIGLVAADLLTRDSDPRWSGIVRRSLTITSLIGLGHHHSLCHGDLGTWELFDRAVKAGLAPPETAQRAALEIVASLESHGPVTGLACGVFQPGLILGAGGVAYQLLRLHPACDLPSVLLPDPR
jgi:type 2 lantibiotic biosynthesis protein LanM